MDSTEAKALANNLRKAKKASSPYYWSFVLEGSDGDPCLFFEKKEGLAKKKSKEARKTARKKKVAMGIMDYSSGKMVLRSDGKIADSLIIKALKKLIKSHGELSLLKRLTVDSSTEEEPQESVPRKKKKPKQREGNEEIVGNTVEGEINTNLEESNQWKVQWEAKYVQVKDILKAAIKSPAAQKEKVQAKINEYKERLKSARSSFKAAVAPFDEATRTRLDKELEAARKSILKMAEKLRISVPPLVRTTSTEEVESPEKPSMDSYQNLYSKLDAQYIQLKKTVEDLTSSLNEAKLDTTRHSDDSREKMGLADSILLVITGLTNTLNERFTQFGSVVQKTTDVRAAESLSKECAKKLTEVEQKRDEVQRFVEETITLHKNTTPTQPLQETGWIGPLILQAQGLQKLDIFASNDGDDSIKKTRTDLKKDIEKAISDLQTILSKHQEGKKIAPSAEEKQKKQINTLSKKCGDLKIMIQLGDASTSMDEKVKIIWRVGIQLAKGELDRFKQSIRSNTLVSEDIRFAALKRPLNELTIEDTLTAAIDSAGNDKKKLVKAINTYEKSIASAKKKWSSIDSNSHFGSFSIVSSIDKALSDIKSTIQK